MKSTAVGFNKVSQEPKGAKQVGDCVCVSLKIFFTLSNKVMVHLEKKNRSTLLPLRYQQHHKGPLCYADPHPAPSVAALQLFV